MDPVRSSSDIPPQSVRPRRKTEPSLRKVLVDKALVDEAEKVSSAARAAASLPTMQVAATAPNRFQSISPSQSLPETAKSKQNVTQSFDNLRLAVLKGEKIVDKATSDWLFASFIPNDSNCTDFLQAAIQRENVVVKTKILKHLSERERNDEGFIQFNSSDPSLQYQGPF